MENRIALTAKGKLDEIVVDGGAHLEKQGKGQWFLSLERKDGSSVAVWISGTVDMFEERPAPAVAPLDALKAQFDLITPDDNEVEDNFYVLKRNDDIAVQINNGSEGRMYVVIETICYRLGVDDGGIEVKEHLATPELDKALSKAISVAERAE